MHPVLLLIYIDENDVTIWYLATINICLDERFLRFSTKHRILIHPVLLLIYLDENDVTIELISRNNKYWNSTVTLWKKSENFRAKWKTVIAVYLKVYDETFFFGGQRPWKKVFWNYRIIATILRLWNRNGNRVVDWFPASQHLFYIFYCALYILACFYSGTTSLCSRTWPNVHTAFPKWKACDCFESNESVLNVSAHHIVTSKWCLVVFSNTCLKILSYVT